MEPHAVGHFGTQARYELKDRKVNLLRETIRKEKIPYGVSSNDDGRVTASKYARKPVALLCPPQKPPVPLVPIRVSSLSDKISVLPFPCTFETGGKFIMTSLA